VSRGGAEAPPQLPKPSGQHRGKPIAEPREQPLDGIALATPAGGVDGEQGPDVLVAQVEPLEVEIMPEGYPADRCLRRADLVLQRATIQASTRMLRGRAWPSAKLHAHILSPLPTGTFPGVDDAEVYRFLAAHAGEQPGRFGRTAGS
jgi:hypothetical protein